MKYAYIALACLLFYSCDQTANQFTELPERGIQLMILGTIQDAGSPHIGCNKECCSRLFETPDKNRMVSSVGIIDFIHNSSYLIDATPDMGRQMKLLKKAANSETEFPDGIFLTHAHAGHYTGLMYLGKEGANADSVPVYAMPKMRDFIENNEPWKQLVSIKNIEMRSIVASEKKVLNDSLSVVPFLVPHRDELSETVGYKIIGPNKTALFIPDINKWNLWDKSIVEEIKQVDYAFLDATFYDQNEVPHRNMDEIPHPFVVESVALFSVLSDEDKAKIHFTHFNHTNPLLNNGSNEFYQFRSSGFNIAQVGNRFEL